MCGYVVCERDKGAIDCYISRQKLWTLKYHIVVSFDRFALQILQKMSKPVDLRNRETLIDAVVTCLSSKVVSQNSDILAPVAVDAVLNIIDPDKSDNVDLNDIRIVKQLGGTVDDTELVPGIVFEKGWFVSPSSSCHTDTTGIYKVPPAQWVYVSSINHLHAPLLPPPTIHSFRC